MLELLRDSIWQFIGAALGLAALVVSCVIYFVQRRKKSLSYQVIYQAKLFDRERDYTDQFKVSYKGRRVEDVGIVAIRIENDGNQPITAADFETPLRFEFTDNVSLLSVDVTYTFPSNLRVNTSLEKNAFTVAPLLLNKKDLVEVDVLLNGGRTAIAAEARIVGVTEVKRTYGASSFNARALVGMSSVALMFLAAVFFFFAFPMGLSISLLLGIGVSMVGLMATLTYRMYLSNVTDAIRETRGSILD